MEIFKPENITKLINKFPRRKFVVLGELHGINENALIVKKIVDAIDNEKTVYLAYEWLLSEAEENDLNNYLLTEKPLKKIPPFFLDSDGRITSAHIKLLKHIKLLNNSRTKKIKIIPFDSNAPEYEKQMAEKLLKINKNTLTIVVSGSIHARRNSKNKTFVDILSEKREVSNIFIKYIKGTINVEENIFSVTDSEEQKIGANEQFDFEITIDCANHSNTQELLTEVNTLCTIE